MHIRTLLFLAFVSTLSCSLDAHDFWLNSNQLRTDLGQRVELSFQVGHAFRGEVLPFESRRVEKLVAIQPSIKNPKQWPILRPVLGQGKAGVAGEFLAEETGSFWMTFESKPTSNILRADAFEAYLKEEGLDSVLEMRRELGESDRIGFELYSRCCKTLISVGDQTPDESIYTLPLGLTLELVATGIPKAKAPMSFQLLYEGKPCAGTLIEAYSQENPEEVISTRSDKDGFLHYTLPKDGPWLVTCVHMVPAAAGAKAEWQSYWSSLLFEVSSN